MKITNDWKKTAIREVDLLDLLNRLLCQWKFVLLAGIVCGAFLGICGYVRTNHGDDGPGITLEEDEQREVNDAVALYNALQEAENYNANSILMGINAYQKNQTTLIYSIEADKKSMRKKLRALYTDYIEDGALSSTLIEEDSSYYSMDENYLSELLAVKKNILDEDLTDIEDEELTTDDSILTVRVTGTDADMAEKIAKDIADALVTYARQVNKDVGTHSLKLLYSMSKVKKDDDLVTKQGESRNIISSTSSSLLNAQNDFSSDQRSLYEKTIGAEEKESTTSWTSVIKYVILGGVLGVFGYCALYACWFAMSDALKSVKEFMQVYTIPLLGSFAIDRKTQDEASAKELEKILCNIKMLCRTKKLDKLMIATNYSADDKEGEWVNTLTQRLSKDGIKILPGENMVNDGVSWENMQEAGNVIIVSRIGKTTHHVIDRQMTFCRVHEIEVLGAIVLG